MEVAQELVMEVEGLRRRGLHGWEEGMSFFSSFSSFASSDSPLLDAREEGGCDFFLLLRRFRPPPAVSLIVPPSPPKREIKRNKNINEPHSFLFTFVALEFLSFFHKKLEERKKERKTAFASLSFFPSLLHLHSLS
jgi:hypothetical protein